MTSIRFHDHHVKPNRFETFAEFAKGQLRNNYCSFYEEFLQANGATLPSPWATQDTSAAGSPVLGVNPSSGVRNGVYRITMANTSEAENLTLYWGDSVCVPASRGWIFECGVSVLMTANTNVGPWSADQRAVFGMASARNATLDSVTHNAWFRLEGANFNIYSETDDNGSAGTGQQGGDIDDRDTGFDIVSQTNTRFLIDSSDSTNVHFYVDLADGNGWQESTGGPHLCGNWAVADRLQPFFEVQKDAGTEVDAISIDYCALAWLR